MADQTALDYLGREAPISLAERPALPTSGAPLGVSTAAPTASGGGTVPSLGATTAAATRGASPASVSRPGQVTTTASGEPGVPGALVSSGGGGGGELLSTLITQALTKGAEPLDKIINRLIAFAQGDQSALSTEGFSLFGDSPSSVLDASGGFTFDAGQVNAMLPDLLRLRGLFDEGGQSVLDPSAFSLFAQEGAQTLDPSAFSLGVDTSMNAPELSQSASSGGNPWAALASSAMNIGGMFAGDNPELQVALKLGGAIAGAFSNPFMAAWQAPGVFNDIHEILTGDTQVKRRIQRMKDAGQLQGDILGPLSQARTPEETMAALNANVGGVRVGDALASILRNNLTGTYYTDTAHNWLPDLSLIPMYEGLTGLGFSGTREPTLGDVGGVGEIIAGAGQRLIPPSAYERGGPFYPGVISDEGGQMTDVGSWGQWGPGKVPGLDLGSPKGGGGASGGALGWESVLRALAGAESAPSMVATPLIYQGGVRNTSDEGGGFINPETGASVPLEVGLPPAYLEALRAYDPTTGENIAAATQRAVDDYYLQLNMGSP